MKRWMFFLLLLVSSPLGVGAREPAFSDAKNGFQLIPPGGWESHPEIANQNAVAAVFLGPLQKQIFRANINVMVQPMSDLQAYTKLTLSQIQSNQGIVVKQTDLKLGSWPGRQFIWKATMKGSALQFNSTFACQSGKTYLFTGSSLQSNWAEVSGLFEKSAASLRLSP